MASNTYVESLVSAAKRLKISSSKVPSSRASPRRSIQTSAVTAASGPRLPSVLQNSRSASQLTTQSKDTDLRNVRLPKAVQAVFLTPLKRAPTHGIPVCDLQIRSYSVRNLDAFADFCMRAAYFLKLPAKGPVPLPRITERWTVPRSNFVHKKSQENFERITMRRLIQIQDGHPETVAIWLAYIQKQRYYGVGMKANVFEHGKLDVVQDMEAEGERLRRTLGEEWNLFSQDSAKGKKIIKTFDERFIEQPFKRQWGAAAGMSSLGRQASGRQRFQRRTLPEVTGQQPRTASATPALLEGQESTGTSATASETDKS